VLLSLNEITVESCSEGSRRGSWGPPTRDGSSPSESANERPEIDEKRQWFEHNDWIIARERERGERKPDFRFFAFCGKG